MCSSMGAQILFVAIDGHPVYVCPMCEVAWPTPQRQFIVDSADTIDDLAPNGVRLPSDAEIDAVRASGVQLAEVAVDWAEFVVDLLSDGCEVQTP